MIESEEIEFEVDGRRFGALFTQPDGAPRGGVLVFHGGGGLSAHERTRLDALRALGFAALAPDLFGETAGMAAIRALLADPAPLRARVTAALAALAARVAGPLAAIGHCFGGYAALELARTGAAIDAAISFHGRLATAAPAARGEVRARVLACTGADDPHCPADQRAAFEREMTTCGADWQHLVLGGAQHGFTVPGVVAPGCAYDERADRRSWRAALDLLT